MSQTEKHTLLIVEEDVLDDPELYQVTYLAHDRDHPAWEPIRVAHRELVDVATEETGVQHRLVIEQEDPGLTKMHYEMHVEELEA